MGGPCRIEMAPGSGEWRQLDSPLAAEQVAAAVSQLAAPVSHHSVSLTGGEPLLHGAFVAELAQRLRRLGLAVYLETACHHPEAMERAVRHVQWVSADLKLPSTMRRPGR